MFRDTIAECRELLYKNFVFTLNPSARQRIKHLEEMCRGQQAEIQDLKFTTSCMREVAHMSFFDLTERLHREGHTPFRKEHGMPSFDPTVYHDLVNKMVRDGHFEYMGHYLAEQKKQEAQMNSKVSPSFP